MRIKLDMPENILFSTKIDVLVQHLNYGNHLGNDSILSIIHEARVRFFYHLGYTEKDISGTGIIMTDVAIVYQSEGFYGNSLNIQMAVADVTLKSFDLYYQIYNESTKKTLAIAKTGILGFDYETKRSKKFSDLFLSKIS